MSKLGLDFCNTCPKPELEINPFRIKVKLQNTHTHTHIYITYNKNITLASIIFLSILGLLSLVASLSPCFSTEPPHSPSFSFLFFFFFSRFISSQSCEFMFVFVIFVFVFVLGLVFVFVILKGKIINLWSLFIHNFLMGSFYFSIF